MATSTQRTIWTRIIAFGAWLGRLALTLGMATILAAINVYVTLIIIVVSVVIMIFDDNTLQKWFDRCCFSKQTDRDAFDDLTEELTEFHIAIKECF